MAFEVETGIQNDLADILKALDFGDVPDEDIGKIREAPKVDEVIDKVPCILICNRGPDKSEPLGFEGAVSRTYTEEIILVGGREGDLASLQAQASQWKEMCVDAIDRDETGQFRTTLPNVPTVYAIEIGSISSIDRSKLASQYAYTSFFVVVRSSE